MADETFRRMLTAHFGPELHARAVTRTGTSSPDEARSAVLAALRHHVPEQGEWGTSCSCWVRGGSRSTWPCAEVTDILLALTGTGD